MTNHRGPLTLAELQRLSPEKRGRYVAAMKNQRAAFTVEKFCGAHSAQLEFCRDRRQWIHVMCARQSGKTWGDLAILLTNALEAPGCKGLFLGLKGTGVKEGAWLDWKALLEAWNIPLQGKPNETSMLTVFANGSRVQFGGTDDLENIKKYLGKRLDHGVVVIDEAQDQRDEIIVYLTRQLLPPMLTPTSRVILSGVLPDVPAGAFYELATDKPLAEAPEQALSKGYSHHEWGRAENVHTPEAMAFLRAYMDEHKIDESDPQIQRDWHMRRIWEKGATAYGYEVERNGYHAVEPDWLDEALIEIVTAVAKRYPDRKDLLRLYARTSQPAGADCRFGIMAAVPKPGITIFSCAIDQARGDRFAVEVTGWGPTVPDVQHVFEFSTPRRASITLGQAAPVLKIIAQRLHPSWYFMDGVENEIDTFAVDYGIPSIKAPDKRDLPGQVKRTKDIMQQGRFAVMIGSAMEQDFQKAKREIVPGAFKWAASWHPDPSEAGRYSLSPYFDTYRPPRPPTIFDSPTLKRLLTPTITDGPDYR